MVTEARAEGNPAELRRRDRIERGDQALIRLECKECFVHSDTGSFRRSRGMLQVGLNLFFLPKVLIIETVTGQQISSEVSCTTYM